MGTVDLGDMQVYERQVKDLVTAMQSSIETIVHLSSEGGPNLGEILKEFMPISKDLAHDKERDQHGLAEEGKAISEIIHLLGEHGIFRKSLLDHIVILKSLAADLAKTLKEAYRGNLVATYNPKTQEDINHIAGKITKEIEEVIDSLEKAKKFFGKMYLIASDIHNDTKWNNFISELSKRYPALSEHRTAMMTPFNASAQILKEITQQFILLQKQCNINLTEIQKSIAQIQKGNIPKENVRPEQIVERLILLLANIEQPLYHDLIPKLYTFQRIENTRKKVIGLEGDFLHSMNIIYREIGAMAARSQ